MCRPSERFGDVTDASGQHRANIRSVLQHRLQRESLLFHMQSHGSPKNFFFLKSITKEELVSGGDLLTN